MVDGWQAGGQSSQDISLLGGAMLVSGSLSVIEAHGWSKRMKTTVLDTQGLNGITSSVPADRNWLIQRVEISIEEVSKGQDATLCRCYSATSEYYCGYLGAQTKQQTLT